MLVLKLLDLRQALKNPYCWLKDKAKVEHEWDKIY